VAERQTRPETGEEGASLFDPAICSHTKRGLRNVTKAFANILLDNDTGAFSIEKFATMFPALKFVACNTFNTTAAVRKYRLIVAADRVMTAEVYGIVAKSIVSKIAEVCPDHGFDATKLNAVGPFYLPCQSKENGSSFFFVHSGNPLDVSSWVRDSVMAEQEPLSCSPARPPINAYDKEQRIQRVIAKWRNGNHTDGHDYSQFYALGLSLMGFCRCDEAEVRSILAAEASYSHDPENRLKQIEQTIKGAKEQILSAVDYAP
jgi:hypothetical protein